MYLIRRETIVPDIDYTVTEMEFTSINIRMTLTNTKVMTPSGTIIPYIEHSTVININKSVNYFKQKCSYRLAFYELFVFKTGHRK